MSSVRSDAEGAVNAFIKDQQEVPGDATLLLVEFDATRDHLGDQPWYHVVHDGDLKAAPRYRLQPRGNTALLDAIGRAINETGIKLAALSEDQRPAHVFFVVQTDGMENASREFTRTAIQEMIKRQTDEFSWEFVFLGMGPDTFAQGHNLGFGNVTKAAHTAASYAATYDSTSYHMANVRGGVERDMSGANVEVDDEGNVTPT
jgi:hypothetical protein